MKITTITYRRVKNLGNYESETVEATSAVDEGEVADAVIAQLRDWVLDQLDLRPRPEPDIDEIKF